MRQAAVSDCLRVLEYFGVDSRATPAIDVGGTPEVALQVGRAVTNRRNPLLEVNPEIRFLDRGFNIELLKTRADTVVDFLDEEQIAPLERRFNLVFSFDTLEHVSNPFKFCEHLARIAKPGGFIYVATVFTFAYHPSPEDYYRFSPSGLRQCFTDAANRMAGSTTVVWSGWGSDSYGVSLLAYRGTSFRGPSADGLDIHPPQASLLRGLVSRVLRVATERLGGWHSPR